MSSENMQRKQSKTRNFFRFSLDVSCETERSYSIRIFCKLVFLHFFFFYLFRNQGHHKRLFLRLAWKLQRLHSLSQPVVYRKNLQTASLCSPVYASC